MVSSVLCHYLLQKNSNMIVAAIDTDKVNHTLGGYKELHVQELEIRTGDNIDPRKFDELMEIIDQTPDDSQVVIDNGAATFLPLCSWMVENQTIDMWIDQGYRVLLHSVVTGGQAIRDTTKGLNALATRFSSPIIVWLNYYFGDIAFGNNNVFEKFTIYEKNKEKIEGIIRIPLKTASTFGKDLEDLFARHQTFADAINDGTLPIMTRQRLRIWWKEMCQAISDVQVI